MDLSAYPFLRASCGINVYALTEPGKVRNVRNCTRFGAAIRS